jgi:hypothetical protein
MRAGWLGLAGVLAFAAWTLPAPGEPGPLVRVDYSNPGLTPPHWTLVLYPDGSGHFRSERGNPPAGSAQISPPTIMAVEVDREVRVSAEFAGRVFLAARRHKWFSEGCESREKVAFQGLKTLTYAGPEGLGSCEFNYSKDKELQELSDCLVGVAATILEGARLEKLLLHDRLGLDQEMEYLTEASGDGRLQQIGVIRGILERLEEDPSVMERVRKRARVLLTKMGE